jgi:hypothetical protein
LAGETDKDKSMIKAEILFNSGLFAESGPLLDRLSDYNLMWVNQKLLNEIVKQNKRVFQLF